MSFRHVITRAFTKDGAVISSTDAVDVDGEDNRDPVCAGSATTTISLTLDKTKLKSLFLLSDKDMTLRTNDPDSGADTILLKAAIAYEWTAASGVTNPIGTNITALYAVVAGSDAALLKIRIGKDATP